MDGVVHRLTGLDWHDGFGRKKVHLWVDMNTVHDDRNAVFQGISAEKLRDLTLMETQVCKCAATAKAMQLHRVGVIAAQLSACIYPITQRFGTIYQPSLYIGHHYTSAITVHRPSLYIGHHDTSAITIHRPSRYISHNSMLTHKRWDEAITAGVVCASVYCQKKKQRRWDHTLHIGTMIFVAILIALCLAIKVLLELAITVKKMS